MTCEKTSISCSDCPTRQTSEWRALSEEELRLVDQSKRTRAYEPGQALYHQGDNCEGIYCIQSGLIGLRRLDENGNSVLVRLCNPGGTIGYRALLSRSDHHNTAEVLTPGVICFIERSLVKRLLAENPLLGERFLQHGVEDLSRTEDDYVKSMTMGARKRFLHALMVLYENYGYQDDSEKYILEIPIPRKDLAAMIGSSPESISRIIRKLEAEGLMHFEDRQVGFWDINSIFEQIGLSH